jgi:hypothetical protein
MRSLNLMTFVAFVLGMQGTCAWAQSNFTGVDIKKEALAKWTEYRRRFASLKRESKGVSFQDGTKNGETRSRIYYGSHGVLSVYEHVYPPESAYAYALVLNAEYAFELSRKDPTAKWVVVNINTDLKEGIKIAKMDDVLFLKKHYDFVGPFEASGNWLPNYLPSPGFTIKKIEAVNAGPDELIKLHFQHQPTEADKKRSYYPARGWIVLDPNQYWRVCESEIQNVYRGDAGRDKIHSSIDCVILGGIPVLTKRVSRGEQTFSKKTTNIVATMEYSVSNDDPAAEEFTLSAFGLPEPITATPPAKPRYWLWLSVGGFIVLAMAVWVRRRHAANSPATSS